MIDKRFVASKRHVILSLSFEQYKLLKFLHDKKSSDFKHDEKQ